MALDLNDLLDPPMALESAGMRLTLQAFTVMPGKNQTRQSQSTTERLAPTSQLLSLSF